MAEQEFPPLGRASKLRDPEFLKHVALCFHEGMSREAMCKELGVKSLDTITNYRRDPRVKAIVQKLNADRAIQVSSKVDSIIQGRLAHAKDMRIDELVKIRKEYGGPAVKRGEVDDAVVSEGMKALEQNPALAEELAELLGKQPPKTADPAGD